MALFLKCTDSVRIITNYQVRLTEILNVIGGNHISVWTRIYGNAEIGGAFTIMLQEGIKNRDISIFNLSIQL